MPLYNNGEFVTSLNLNGVAQDVFYLDGVKIFDASDSPPLPPLPIIYNSDFSTGIGDWVIYDSTGTNIGAASHEVANEQLIQPPGNVTLRLDDLFTGLTKWKLTVNANHPISVGTISFWLGTYPTSIFSIGTSLVGIYRSSGQSRIYNNSQHLFFPEDLPYQSSATPHEMVLGYDGTEMYFTYDGEEIHRVVTTLRDGVTNGGISLRLGYGGVTDCYVESVTLRGE